MSLSETTRTIQGIVGVPADGVYGPATAIAVLTRLGHNGVAVVAIGLTGTNYAFGVFT